MAGRYNVEVATCGFEEARGCVISAVSGAGTRPAVEEVALAEARGRVVAEDILADRSFPAASRSARDGFAVHAADVPGTLEVIGEVKAGEAFPGIVHRGQAVAIMTGAPMPEGSDAVVMVEHTNVEGGRLSSDRTLAPGENFTPAGVEAQAGDTVLPRGAMLGFAEIAMAAAVGQTMLRVYVRPRVGILATGDELVDIAEAPRPWQVRNSNSRSLAAQVAYAGGIPCLLPVARDTYEATRVLVERGLEYDLLLISGGVSAGKYDVVESVLSDLGAEFYFDRVRMQPGQPVVFGRAGGTFFFGLPGNPLSGMVTFETLGRAALELIAGRAKTTLPLLWSRLGRELRQRTGLTRFIPACLSDDGATVTPAGSHSSGDIPAVVRANAWLVSDPDRERYEAGELVRVMRKG